MKMFRGKASGREAPSQEISAGEHRRAHLQQGRFLGHAGFPEATDGLAYDPIQRLLAVGTRDGRIKVLGRDGVEQTFFPSVHSPTKFMQFLHNKGAILRVTEEGDVELWGCEKRGLVDSIRIGEGQAITAVAVFAERSYILLGCDDGSVRVVGIQGEDSDAVDGIFAAQTLKELPYEVTRQELGGEGPVVAIALHATPDTDLLLVVHAASGAVVWDMRNEGVIARTPASPADPGEAGADRDGGCAGRGDYAPATAGCWVGRDGHCFATGHMNADVLLWGIREGQEGANSEQTAVCLGCRRVAVNGDAAAPVHSLAFVEGRPSQLLMFGGQPAEQPDMLSLLPLDSSEGSQSGEQQQVHSLPWFGPVKGYALVPPEGALSPTAAPAAILVLTEGGQLMVHDLATLQPIPLSLPFQELAQVTTARLLSSSSEAASVGIGSGASHILTLERLRVAGKASARDLEVVRGNASRWRWVFAGGRPAAPAGPEPGVADIYVTGHSDGRVRVWDMTAPVPALLATVPFDSGGAGHKLYAVTALEVCALSGLLVVGHEKGEVRVYQFNTDAAVVTRMSLPPPPERGTVDDGHPGPQPAGFQCLLRAPLHAAPVQAIALANAASVVAVGYAGGMISLLQLCQPAAVYVRSISQQPITALDFGRVRLTNRRDTNSTPESRLVLFVLLADSTVMLVDGDTGELVSNDSWLRPRNPEPSVGLVLLGVDSVPVQFPASPLSLPWANNDPVLAASAGSPASQPSSSPYKSDSDDAASSLLDRQSGIPIIGSLPSLDDQASLTGHDEGGPQPHDSGGLPHDEPDPELAAAPKSLASAKDMDAVVSPSLHLLGREPAPGPSKAIAAENNADLSEDADSDNDDLLAAAAAAVEAKEQSKKKPGMFERIKSAAHKHPLASSIAEESKDTDRSSRHKDKLGLWARKGHSDARGPAPLTLSASTSTEDETSCATPSTPGSTALVGAESTPSSIRISLPGVRTLDPVPSLRARFTSAEGAEEVLDILLITNKHLRVYPCDTVRLRTVSSSRKVALGTSVVKAQAIMTPEGPALLLLSTSDHLLTVSLPGMEVTREQALEELLGFQWAGCEAHALEQLQSRAAMSADGQVVLVGACGELTRVGVRGDAAEPAGPNCLYDWDLSHAATAAARALSASGHVTAPQPPTAPSLMAHESAEQRGGLRGIAAGIGPTWDAARGGVAGLGAGVAGFGAGVGGFFHQVRDAAKTMVDETVEGLPKLARGMDRLGRDILHARPPFGGAEAATSRTGRSLDDVFHGRVVEEVTITSIPSPSPMVSDLRRTSDMANTQSEGRGAGRGPTTTPGPSGRPLPRTAEEIKAAYGRPTKKAGELASIMGETQAALAERGERLNRLQDKTAAMEEEAASFASMAKQLRDREANRRWFNFSL